jgi:hypothetical protein
LAYLPAHLLYAPVRKQAEITVSAGFEGLLTVAEGEAPCSVVGTDGIPGRSHRLESIDMERKIYWMRLLMVIYTATHIRNAYFTAEPSNRTGVDYGC